MTLSLLLTVCVALPAPALAQSVGATTGVVNGRVTDATGAVLSGVTVTISSDALIADMGTRTTVTGAEGAYRFVALAPGEYTLAFARDGFTTLAREAIYVAAGVTATIDAALAVAALHERVAVERGGPVIDRHATAVAVNFDARLLADLPWARSMSAILTATPSVHVTRVDVGGNTENLGPYGAYGTNGQNLPMVEGMNVSGILGTGFTLDHGAFEEVTVSTAAHGAEWRMAGVHMQFIARSGGNRYRGRTHAHYADRGWQAVNIDADQVRRGARGGDGLAPREANRLWSQRDVNADVGGFIRKDSVWWFGSVRDEEVAARFVTFPVKPHRTRITNYLAKTTYRTSANTRLVAFGQAGRNHQPNRLDPFGPTGSPSATTAIHEAEGSTAEQLARGRLWKTEWNAVLQEAFYFEVRAGQFATTRAESPNGTSPRFEDVVTQRVLGGGRGWQHDFRRDQLTGSLSHFRSGRFGDHQVKLGGEVLRITSAEIWRHGYPGDVLHVLENGVPREVYLFETPSRSESGLWLYSAYAGDSWRVNRRLTVNLGLRFDRSRVFLPAQVHPVGRFNSTEQRFAAVDNVGAWNAFAPRAGLAYAISADGKTVAKLSYGRYSVPPGTDVGANANPNAVQWWQSFGWSDPNGSGVWEPGEQGRPRARRGGAGIESLDPRLELPYVTEAAGWLERELPGDVGIRTGIVWRGTRRQRARGNINRPFDAFSVPISISDPGPDGIDGTFDDGPAIQAFELTPERLDPVAFPLINVVRNVPGSDGYHWTWDTIATRRINGRWSFTAGFTRTWSRDHASVFFGQAVRSNMFPLTPNDLINAAPDGRHEFTTWTAKAYGTYHGPWGLRIAPLLRHQSGQPFGRTLVASLNYGNVRILAEPVGTRRMDPITIVDLHVEKGFRLPEGRRVAAFVDVFNLLNANPEESTSWSSGASFLRPLSIVAPRIARVGAKLQW